VGNDAAVLPGGGDQGGRNGTGDRAHEVHESSGGGRLFFVDRSHGEPRQGHVVHRHADPHEEERDADHPVAHVGGGVGTPERIQAEPQAADEDEDARIDSVSELGRDRGEDDRQEPSPRDDESRPSGGVAHVVLQPLRRQHVETEEGAKRKREHQHAGAKSAMAEDA